MYHTINMFFTSHLQYFPFRSNIYHNDFIGIFQSNSIRITICSYDIYTHFFGLLYYRYL